MRFFEQTEDEEEALSIKKKDNQFCNKEQNSKLHCNHILKNSKCGGTERCLNSRRNYFHYSYYQFIFCWITAMFASKEISENVLKVEKS